MNSEAVVAGGLLLLAVTVIFPALSKALAG